MKNRSKQSRNSSYIQINLHLKHLFQLYVRQLRFSTNVCSIKLPTGHSIAYDAIPRRILYSVKMWTTLLNMTLFFFFDRTRVR